jgi:Cd2+/Zn2+-exporting ATPase
MNGSHEGVRRSLWKKRDIAVIVTSLPLLIIGLYFELMLEKPLPATFLFLTVVAIAGHGIILKGLSSVFKKRLTMNFLITIAAVGAFLIGHGEEGAAIIFLFYIAEFLEEYATERTRRSVEALMKLAPEVATVKRDGKEIKVHARDVNIGEIVTVRPGEKIPLDGIVLKGASSVNQAPITGESMPIEKRVNDEVYAGTLNCEGFLEIKVTKKSEETMLSKIVKLVEKAQKRKSPTEKIIDRFSTYYTPSVIFLAILVATIPTLVFSMPLDQWVYKALILLVVSCPCALVISTPVSIVSGITNAARNGILIKGGRYIEEIKKIKAFIFDKTGTLTEGKLEVTDVLSLSNSDEKVLEVAASIENLSEHPIAKAIVEKAKKEKIKLKHVKNFNAIVGKGAKGEINKRVFYVGSKKLFKELSVKFSDSKIERLEREGKTVVLVGTEKEVIGIVALADKIRKATIKAIRELRNRGIENVMITGDNERTAKAIAKQVGIDHFHAELSPEEKVEEVEYLRKKFDGVVMIGDGVNDAPALAQANVGIAMGAIGSDVALETADVALMHDDLSKLPYLVDLSKKTVKVMKQNIFASIAVKGSFAVLAFPGIVTLWLAVGIGDMGLSLAVILNAIRLGVRGRFKAI